MVEIKDRESLEAWLKTRPTEDAVLIAARAALRVLPLTVRALSRDETKRRAEVILPTLRATAVTGFAGAWPKPVTRFRAASDAAAAVANVTNAATSAARAAARAAANASRAIANAANAATRAANAAADAAAFANVARAAVFAAVEADADALLQGWLRTRLALKPVWHGSAPDWAAEHWAAFKSHLLGACEDWQVWTDWYERHLNGSEPVEAVERCYVDGDEDFWTQPPAAINAEIARRLAALPASAETDIEAPPPPLHTGEIAVDDDGSEYVGVGDQWLPRSDDAPARPKRKIVRSFIPRPSAPAEEPPPDVKPATPAPPARKGPPTVAFFSYTRRDDELSGKLLSKIRKELEKRISFLHGSDLDVFQDLEDIEGGDIWRERLEQALAEATIFVPMVTPAFFNSPHCREELERFLARGDAGTFVLPIHFVRTDFAESAARDTLTAAIEARQWFDWCEHNGRSNMTQSLRNEIDKAARVILDRWRSVRSGS